MRHILSRIAPTSTRRDNTRRRPTIGLNLRIADDGEPGQVIVVDVLPGSLASAAGIRVGDILEGMNGHRLNSPQSIRDAAAAIGNELRLVYRSTDGHRTYESIPVRSLACREICHAG